MDILPLRILNKFLEKELIVMKIIGSIIKSTIAIMLSVFLFTGLIGQSAVNQLAAQQENVQQNTAQLTQSAELKEAQETIDAQAAEIKMLTEQLDAATQGHTVVLRFEIQLISGLFGDTFSIDCGNMEMQVSQTAFDSLTVGQDLSTDAQSGLDMIADFRIIVESIA